MIRSALGSGGLGVLQVVLSLLTTIVVARALGTEGYGYYAFAIAVVSVIAIPTYFGLPALLTREIASSHAHTNWSLMHGLRHRSMQLMGMTVVFAVVMIGGILIFVPIEIGALDLETFTLALLLLPLWAGMGYAKSLLSGLRMIIHATWPSATLQPTIFLLSLLGLMFVVQSLAPPIVIGANIIATIIALLTSLFLLKKNWPGEARNAQPVFETRRWLRSLVPFAMISVINIINAKADIVMLGAMKTAGDVGIYSIAVQASLLVSFSLNVINPVLSPNVSRLNALGTKEQMQRLLTLTTGAIFLIAGITAAIFFAAGEWIIEKAFGLQYIEAYVVLCVLMIGQLFNSAMGSVGIFLNMTGYENETLRAIAISALANVVLNAFLIPRFGVVGAASATAFSLILWNIILGVRVYRCLGLMPGPVVLRAYMF